MPVHEGVLKMEKEKGDISALRLYYYQFHIHHQIQAWFWRALISQPQSEYVLFMAVRSHSQEFTYDVFLNFRGSDTRYGFAGNLYKALDDRGIHTFIDDKKLRGGDELAPTLVKAIQESRIAITVLSITYASSSFCLDELVYILDRADEKKLLVLPVFYNVDPSFVRHQKGSFGEALAWHEERLKADNKERLNHHMEKLEKWKMALHQVANLSGFHYKYGEGYEYKFIGKIVEWVSSEINRAPLHVADYPVGLDSQVLKVMKLLDVGSSDGVLLIGIYGMGGVGKTSLASAVYNLIASHFDGSCFLQNVREKSRKHGLVHLQSIILSEMLGDKRIMFESEQQGISMIQHRLQHKRLLLILDDVDKHELLQTLVGRPDCFGPGSKVIITTRDKQLLASHHVQKTYKVKKLNKNHALQLLTWKVFKSEQVYPEYEEVLNRAVTYACGLPLALEVIGANLCGKSIQECKSVIDQYKRIPNNRIQETLKVSFDALQEEEKRVFLDISCCFKGYKLTEVEDILHAHHGACMKYHIGVLAEKSFIKIGQYDCVTLHDLVEDMGKEIVRQESPEEPGKRSRLWSPKDIIQVLEDNTKLRNLRVLNFDCCECLTQIPDAVSDLQNLEELSFQNCVNLVRVHNSVGLLEKLRILEASGCIKLRNFPPLKLTSLEKLELSHCSSLERFPEIIGKMENIRELRLLGTLIKGLPLSFQNLTRLKKLSLLFCGIVQLQSSIVMMPELTLIEAWGWEGWQWIKWEEDEEKDGSMVSSKVELLWAPKCNLRDDFFQIGFTRFAHVKDLDLSNNNFTQLPECIKECQFLKKLDVSCCKHLREIRGIPPKLKHFNATNCLSLTPSSISIFLNEDLHENRKTMLVLPGSRNPEWFNYLSYEPSSSFWIRNKFPGKVLCLFVAPKDGDISDYVKLMLVINDKVYVCFFDRLKFLKLGAEHTFLFDLRNLIFTNNLYEVPLENEWNHVKVIYFDSKAASMPIESGIHVFKQESSDEDIMFTDPYAKTRSASPSSIFDFGLNIDPAFETWDFFFGKSEP
ncbi:disease resistance protein TAO1 isoform X2 [Vigna angularis]|uniref:disease resistance protein TAO1 isoform X2 n=1 Tax=Phaseolus angularis TaxID=3914 RepID=UPI0022B3FC2B|nr:disease resistance protein TAO1 isoform X2 [Vigna angularis]